jgi:hypothetical protein
VLGAYFVFVSERPHITELHFRMFSPLPPVAPGNAELLADITVTAP